MKDDMKEVEILLQNVECELLFETDEEFLVTRGEITFEDGEVLQYEKISPIVRVDGLYRRYLYNGDKLNQNKKEIENLLESSFPPTFLKEGGYWSMKLFCKWTEESTIAEMLLALGIGIGKFAIKRFGEAPFILILS